MHVVCATGGYTHAEQRRWEQVRLRAAERLARGDPVKEIGQNLRVTEGWGAAVAPGLAGRDGGTEALESRGPVSRERLSPQQWARLEAKLRKGPLAHRFAAEQRWTLDRIKTLIGKLFRVRYTIEGVWKLLRRHGWSCQVRVRQAIEYDEDAVAVWKAEVWPEKSAARDLGAFICFQLRR